MPRNPAPPTPAKGENARRILRRDPNPKLLSPLQLRSVTVRNRIMLSPMCQYSARDGVPDDWHLVHLGARAVGGTGIVFTESVHTEPRGRITPSCLGLWNDAQQDAFTRIVRFVEDQGAVAAIQIGHAGRKASTTRPWEGGKSVPESEGGWTPIAPSALQFSEDTLMPMEMDIGAIHNAVDVTAASAKRAREAGFRIIEVHAAHGYLINQFLSPLSNQRDDAYGGDFSNRCRLLMETIDAVRGVWPDDLPLFVRLSCTEWVEGGWDMEQSIALCRQLKARGDVDLIDCTSGGNDPRQQIPIYPGYQIPLAETVRRETGMATSAVGLLQSPDLAEEIVANGRADLVALGRALMADPHWPLRAAKALRATNLDWPIQYERSNIY